MKAQELLDGLNGLGFSAGFAIGGEPAEIILWENTEPQPSMEEIEAASADGAFQREYDAVTVARQAGYQSTSDPIFMQYQRDEATKQEWLDAVQAVKDANPYPTLEEVQAAAVVEEPVVTEEPAVVVEEPVVTEEPAVVVEEPIIEDLALAEEPATVTE